MDSDSNMEPPERNNNIEVFEYKEHRKNKKKKREKREKDKEKRAHHHYHHHGLSTAATAEVVTTSLITTTTKTTATSFPHNLKIRFLLSGQRTELSPPTHQSTESSIASVSPRHSQSAKNHSHSVSSASQAQNVTSVESTITSSTTPSPPSVPNKPTKEREERVRSSSPFTSTTSSVPGTGITTGSSVAPSLYVSVPLSTANVPGLNLPTTTTTDHATPSQSTRAATQQQPTVIERQSPRINQQITSSPVVSENVNFSSSHSSPVNAAMTQSGKSTSPNITGASLTASTTESGNLKISYDKQSSRVAQIQEQESAPVRRSRTPDSGIFSSSLNISGNSQSSVSTAAPIPSSNGGLKFSYEPQSAVPTTAMPANIDTILANNSAFKDSPPSSPASETGSARKRGRKTNELKDVKVFHNGCAVSTPVTTPIPVSTTNVPMHASHMLGNQLNPASSVAQKLTDQLHMEMQDHSVYIESQPPQFVGVPFPSKPANNVRNPTMMPSSANSLASMFGGGGGGYAPQSLEQLLERQWEQGSQFLMEQAQHFDIASLLSCLHQLQTENVRLEEHVNNLIARRDHLLAVNARLAIPLNANVPQSQVNPNNIHQNGPTQTEVAVSTVGATTTASVPLTSSANATPSTQNSSRNQRLNVAPTSAVENGIDFRQSSAQQPTSVTGGSTTVSAPVLTQSSTNISLRLSSSAPTNFTTASPSVSHSSNHQHSQHQSHQHQQQQLPSLAQQSTMPSSASNASRQNQQQSQNQPHHPHQQSHHQSHQTHHAHQLQHQALQQHQQSLHSQHQHTQHQSHQLVQHSHNHLHPSSTAPSTATPHHIQLQHHQMTMTSSASGLSGSSRTNNSGSGIAVNQTLSGRPVHNENSGYHPVYSHQSQLRRDESQGKAS